MSLRRTLLKRHRSPPQSTDAKRDPCRCLHQPGRVRAHASRRNCDSCTLAMLGLGPSCNRVRTKPLLVIVILHRVGGAVRPSLELRRWNHGSSQTSRCQRTCGNPSSQLGTSAIAPDHHQTHQPHARQHRPRHHRFREQPNRPLLALALECRRLVVLLEGQRRLGTIRYMLIRWKMRSILQI